MKVASRIDWLRFDEQDSLEGATILGRAEIRRGEDGHLINGLVLQTLDGRRVAVHWSPDKTPPFGQFVTVPVGEGES